MGSLFSSTSTSSAEDHSCSVSKSCDDFASLMPKEPAAAFILSRLPGWQQLVVQAKPALSCVALSSGFGELRPPPLAAVALRAAQSFGKLVDQVVPVVTSLRDDAFACFSVSPPHIPAPDVFTEVSAEETAAISLLVADAAVLSVRGGYSGSSIGVLQQLPPPLGVVPSTRGCDPRRVYAEKLLQAQVAADDISVGSEESIRAVRRGYIRWLGLMCAEAEALVRLMESP